MESRVKIRSLTLLLLMLLTAGSLSARTLGRNETVYVSLGSSGAPQRTEVITWLKSDGRGAVDHARLSGVANIKSLARPQLSGERIAFSGTDANIFYKGTPSRQLPIAVKLSYFLNGRPIAYEKLNGRKGRLKVRLELVNRTGVSRNVTYTEVGTGQRRTVAAVVYTPFIVQVSTSMKIERFPTVYPGDEGVFAVVGDAFKLSWIAMPLPTTTLEFSADAANIAMPAMLITAVPKAIPLAQYRGKINRIPADLNRVYAGVGEVGGYLVQLKDGADQLSAGARQINDGHRQLAAATPKLASGTASLLQALDAQQMLLKNVREINNGIKARLAPLARLTAKVREIGAALDASSEVATRTLEGGSFSPGFLKFLDAQGKPRPPVAEFPASIKTVQAGVVKLNDAARQIDQASAKLLDGSTRLLAGSEKLSGKLALLKQDGTDKIRKQMVSESAEIMLTLARLDACDREARAYDRFAGRPDRVKSSVEFIMKTPGVYVP